MEVRGELGVAVVMVALDGGFLDCPVHPLDLAVSPGMLDLGQPVLDLMFVADPVEDMMEGVFVVRHIGELDPVIRQHGVDGIRHGSDQIAQELGGDHFAGLPVQFNKGELGCPVDCHEEAQLALGGLHLGNVDVEVAYRVGLELALRFLVAGHLGQPADPVALQTAMQG